MTAPDPDDMLRQPLLAHVIELRRRLLWSLGVVGALFGLCYYFAPEIYRILAAPLAAAMGENHRMIYTGLAEAFLTYLKLSLWAACFLACPFVLLQIWRFIAPGLFVEERRAFWPFLVATPVLFTLGAALAYFFVMPLAWQFFLSFESLGAGDGLPIQLEARVGEYLSLAMMLVFGFGLAFDLPVLLVLLVRVGILSVAQLVRARRFAIVGVFVFAAVVTPPDALSQLLLAIPLCLLYELSIIVARLMERARANVVSQRIDRHA